VVKQSGQWVVVTRIAVAFCSSWDSAVIAALYFLRHQRFPPGYEVVL
jgi:hypothetical protein